MTNRRSLTEGNISDQLMKLALPLMGTSFLTMAYNLTDLYWVGKIGTEAVAAVGISGFFWWMVSSLVLICNVGLAVTVSQNLGREDVATAKKYINSGIKLNILIALTYTFIVYFFHKSLINFFQVQDQLTYDSTVVYLKTVSLGFPFLFMNPILAVIINSAGDSKETFKVSCIGVGCNMILDPLLIIVLDMGVLGAALATAISQILVTLIYIFFGIKHRHLYALVDYRESWELKKVREILKLGIPPAMQSAVHCFISMYMGRMIAGFGSAAVAAQSIGSTIEGISWLSAEGYATANASFIGQNYGAQKYDRVNRAFYSSCKIMFLIGLAANLILYFGRYPIIKLFLHEAEAIQIGAMYLMVLSFSQIFMAIEIANGGAFNGISMTHIPSIIGITGNILRIPLAYLLIDYFGLTGIWMAISISSILKGITSFVIFVSIKGRKLKLEGNM